MTSLLDAALEYARLGWRVFPVHTPTLNPDRPCDCGRADCDNIGKHPRIKGWQERATTDEAGVREFWRMYPTANVGIACGEGSGIWVLDVDGFEGEKTLLNLEGEHNEELLTVEQVTGSGGRHLLFRYEPNLKNAVRFAEGLDLRTDGGLIVAPPSLHATGNRYEWEPLSRPDEFPVTLAPRWLVDMIPKRGESGQNGHTPTAGAPIPKGQRQNTLWTNACAMQRRGMGEAPILAAIREQNKQCDPPLDDAALVDIASRASQYEPAGANGASSHGEYEDRQHPLSVGGVCLPFSLIDFGALCNLPEPRYQVEDLFLEESLIQFYGETNHGKSLLCWDLACSTAAGVDKWFGRKVLVPGPVVWINADGGRGLVLRAKAWREEWAQGGGGEMKYPLLTLMGSVHLNKAQQVGQFRQQILGMDERPVLIFFDTQSRCMPGGRENDPDEMTLVTEGLHRIKTEVGCTTALIHHANVSGERERGSGVPKNECDTQIRVTKDAESGIFTAECKKGRDHPEFRPFFFKVRPVLDSVVIVQHDSPPPRTPKEEKLDRQHALVQLVLRRQGVTYDEAAEELDWSAKTIQRDAEDLKDVLDRRPLPKKEGEMGAAKIGLYPKGGDVDGRLAD